MDKISLQKTKLRSLAKTRRSRISPEDKQTWDNLIAQHIIGLLENRPNAVLFSYVSSNSEVDTHQILSFCWKHHRTVAIPKCIGHREMMFYPVTGTSDFAIGAYGIMEPIRCHLPLTPAPDDILLVPGLLFDQTRHRLGYGGGYYDCYLSKHPCLTVGLCYHTMLADTALPQDSFDLPVAKVCTETGFF